MISRKPWKCLCGVTDRAAIHKKSTEQSSECPALLLILPRAQLFSMEHICPVSEFIHNDANIALFSHHLSPSHLMHCFRKRWHENINCGLKEM